MSRAHAASLSAFGLFAAAGLAGFLLARSWLLGAAIFAGCGLVGMVAAAVLFARLATPEEKRRDLEERARSLD